MIPRPYQDVAQRDISANGDHPREFVNGATGLGGAKVAADAVAHGRPVLGMTRSDKDDWSLEAAGAAAHRRGV